MIAQTIEKARADWFGADEGLFDFLRHALTLDLLQSERGVHSKPRLRRFAMKVQQFTGPTMAKSLEDTAFYRYHRLLALNEVGGDPGRFGVSVAKYHEECLETQRSWPTSMTTTTMVVQMTACCSLGARTPDSATAAA